MQCKVIYRNALNWLNAFSCVKDVLKCGFRVHTIKSHELKKPVPRFIEQIWQP